jgi:hypothetical protein
MHKRKLMYYDLKKNWPKVRRHLQDKELGTLSNVSYKSADARDPSRYHTPLLSLTP